MGKKSLLLEKCGFPGWIEGYAAGVADERNRCAEIALDIWKTKQIKYTEKYKMVGRDIAAEILLKIEKKSIENPCPICGEETYAVHITGVIIDGKEYKGGVKRYCLNHCILPKED